MNKNQTTTQTESKQNRNLITVLLCIAGIAVNLLCSRGCSALHLPLYLDTVGTVAVALMGGYLPGVLVGFTTNIVKSLTDISSLYYGVLNVLIALTAALFAKKRKSRSVGMILLMICTFALIGGGLGSLIPMFLEDVSFENASLGALLNERFIPNQTAALLCSNLILDFADKAITVALVLLVIRILPDHIRNHFRFSGWMQTPLTQEDSRTAKRMSYRVISLRTKILLVLSIALIAVSVAATAISMLLYRNALVRNHVEIAAGAAKIAASALDPEAVDRWIAEGETSPGYAETKRMLSEIRDSTADIMYLYVYQIQKNGCCVVFDLDTDELEGSEPGEIIPFDVSFAPYLEDLQAGRPIEPVITDDTFGRLLTAYQPVYDSTGRCVCYAAADVSMDQIGLIERNFFMEMLSLFLGFFILIFAVVRWLVEYHIILPVNSIALSTDAFAYDSETARENSIERIRELNIRTGDEVENLYHAITKTSDDSMRYVADVQEKNEEISQMQKALIIVLADIVESRDKNTGAHVRKTAAYTKLILEELQRMGKYPEILTEAYISDVINSAPLHDVGKIQVPDAILNKPARLTDEEFAIMKTHTTAGKDIISQAIRLVPNSGYLNEARNLAAYHHEKWDGSGYPNGLSGEDIPLSARIMAVADVFDALVSKRSYKEPFSYEQAMAIIREGAGKHFDPTIVEAFERAGDEVRKVEEEFSRMTNESGCFS